MIPSNDTTTGARDSSVKLSTHPMNATFITVVGVLTITFSVLYAFRSGPSLKVTIVSRTPSGVTLTITNHFNKGLWFQTRTQTLQEKAWRDTRPTASQSPVSGTIPIHYEELPPNGVCTLDVAKPSDSGVWRVMLVFPNPDWRPSANNLKRHFDEVLRTLRVKPPLLSRIYSEAIE